ncbi:GNAT family N-acetyltransferase [Microbacterium sp. SL62]|uniref:GNAT family N-acetyltransferase n=1 Tax=Microbacterium sp. SL62 TaxID=2995139 RepID=UPI0022734FA6|nr:GNAT family N-acetyltransferase [Microbacterium sp. SL62]MCY1715639.1 GNAT family N-acetyltransferase [Microbacterium sp. SL62]
MTGRSHAPVVETVTAADVDALLAFWAIAGENDARPSDSASVVEALLRRDPDAVLVVRAEGRIVGTVIAGWDGWRAHLYRLAVHPDHRRQGIARALLDAAEARLRALGAGRFDAMVLEGNDLGASAWAARGYAPQPEWRRWVRSAR